MNQSIIAVDFDGTITKDNDFPNIGELMPGAKEIITELHDKGCIIILWTCRCDEYLDDAIDYCEKNKIPIDYVNENVPEINGRYANPKIFAHYYIDDLNVGGFPGWEKVREIIFHQEGFKKTILPTSAKR